MAAQAARRLGQGTQRESISDDRTAFRHHQQPRFGDGAGFLRGPGKVLAEIDALNGPAEGLELGDNSPVIGIAASRRGEITRHCEGEPLYHKFASYDARARCDSPSVTRIAFTSRPGRPRWSARAAFASCSWMSLVRHSVVVLTPLNSLTSSRLR